MPLPNLKTSFDQRRPKTGATTRMMDDEPEVGGRRSEVSEPSSEPDFSSDF
jgi:hypothetical protein